VGKNVGVAAVGFEGGVVVLLPPQPMQINSSVEERQAAESFFTRNYSLDKMWDTHYSSAFTITDCDLRYVCSPFNRRIVSHRKVQHRLHENIGRMQVVDSKDKVEKNIEMGSGISLSI
jgi:hypothetical protein